MLNWIGIEEPLLQIEEEKEHLNAMIRQLESDGIVVKILSSEACNCQEHLEDGLLILIELAGLPSLQAYIGKMPVIGYALPDTEGFDGRMTYVIGSFEGLDKAYFQMVYQRFYHMPLTIMENNRWLLREITLEDVPLLLELGMSIRNPRGSLSETETNASGLKITSTQEEMDYVQAYVKHMYEFYNYGTWVLCKPSKSIFGIAGLNPIQEEDLPKNSLIRQELKDTFCLQAGYHIAKPYRRKGYAFDTLKAIAAYAFLQIGVDWLVLFIEPTNEASIALADKTGFIKMEHTIYKGTNVQVYVMTEPVSRIYKDF